MVDTNIVIYLLGGGQRAQPYEPYLKGQIAAISFQTVGELRYAALRRGYGTERTEALERMIRRFTVLVGDEATTREWARLKRKAEVEGLSKSCEDLWIAASASRHALPLLTRDSDFYTALDIEVREAPAPGTS